MTGNPNPKFEEGEFSSEAAWEYLPTVLRNKKRRGVVSQDAKMPRRGYCSLLKHFKIGFTGVLCKSD
jgi:hypothetical protein